MPHSALFPTPSEDFELLSNGGRSFTIPVKGQKIVLFTDDIATLPGYNEFTLNPNRLTAAESPFGGVKGSGAAGYEVGTVSINSGTGVYLQSVTGTNTGTVLTAGKLKELGYLTVDTVNKTITEEFVVKNNNTANTATPIDNCDTLDGTWSMIYGTANFSIENGFLKVDGTASGNSFVAKKTVSLNLSSKSFITFDVKGSVAGAVMYCWLSSAAGGSIVWSRGGTTVGTNTTRFVLPLDAPVGSASVYPFSRIGFDKSAITAIHIGISGGITNGSAYTLYIDNICSDVGKWAAVEVAVPDSLVYNSATPLIYRSGRYFLYCHNGSGYISDYAGMGEYNIAGSDVESKNVCMLDGTSSKDIMGVTDGSLAYYMTLYTTARRTETVSKAGGSNFRVDTNAPASYTLSSNYGTYRRILFAVCLPPSDNNRTNFSKMRLKLIIYYDNNGSTTYEFSNNLSQSTGLKNLSSPLIAVLDSSGYVQYLLFTERPSGLSFTRDDSGNIYELTIDPGNAQVYRGSTYLADQTTDTDADYVPDILEKSVTNSLANVFKFNDFNYEQRIQTDLSTSAITTNDFNIKSTDLDIIPFATSSDDIVYNTSGTKLTPAETVVTQTGNVSLYDVRNLSAVQVRDTPGVFSGDCKVWDTVVAGRTDETQWIRVYDPAWVFTGDIFIENGIIRIKIKGDHIGSGLYRIYLYKNGTYQEVARSQQYITSSSGYECIADTVTISSISLDKIKLVVNCYARSYPATVGAYDVILTRGAIWYESNDINNSISRFDTDYTGTTVFHIDSNGVLWDSAIGSRPAMSGYYCATFQRGADSIINMVRSSNTGGGFSGAANEDYIPNNRVIRCAIPFDCSKLFKEAEAFGYESTRYQLISDVDASGGQALQVTVTGGWLGVSQTLTPEFTGTVRIYARVKSTDGASKSFGFACYNTTDSSYIVTAITKTTSSTTYEYIYADLVIPSTHLGDSVNFVIISNTVGGIIDYRLIVPISLIEKYAKRALWNASPGTTSIVNIPH